MPFVSLLWVSTAQFNQIMNLNLSLIIEQVHESKRCPMLRGQHEPPSEPRQARAVRWQRRAYPFSKLSQRMAIDFLVIMNMKLLNDRW